MWCGAGELEEGQDVAVRLALNVWLNVYPYDVLMVGWHLAAKIVRLVISAR